MTEPLWSAKAHVGIDTSRRDRRRGRWLVASAVMTSALQGVGLIDASPFLLVVSGWAAFAGLGRMRAAGRIPLYASRVSVERGELEVSCRGDVTRWPAADLVEGWLEGPRRVRLRQRDGGALLIVGIAADDVDTRHAIELLVRLPLRRRRRLASIALAPVAGRGAAGQAAAALQVAALWFALFLLTFGSSSAWDAILALAVAAAMTALANPRRLVAGDDGLLLEGPGRAQFIPSGEVRSFDGDVLYLKDGTHRHLGALPQLTADLLRARLRRAWARQAPALPPDMVGEDASTDLRLASYRAAERTADDLLRVTRHAGVATELRCRAAMAAVDGGADCRVVRCAAVASANPETRLRLMEAAQPDAQVAQPGAHLGKRAAQRTKQLLGMLRGTRP